MKRLWMAVFILCVLLATCICATLIVDRFARDTVSQLESAIMYAEKNNYAAASQYCTSAAEFWHSKAGLLGALLRHSEADQIDSGLVQLISYAETRDNDEFLALCNQVIHNIEHIRDMELPLLRNIM